MTDPRGEDANRARAERAPHAPQPLLTRPIFYLIVFAVLTIAWTWPLAARLSWRIPHDPGDPLLVTWMLWWNTQAVPLTEAWWNAPIFYPLRGAFALSDHVLGMALFAVPMQFAGASPLFSYNVALLVSYVLSGFFAFLLVRQLTGSTAIALCGGIAYGFAPYRGSQLSHLPVLTSEWMPLALYALHRYLAEGRTRLLVLFGVATLLQCLSSGYYVFFFSFLLACWMAYFVDWRRAPRRGVAIAAAWLIASIPLIPILWKYRQLQSDLGLTRSLSEIIIYSATWRSFATIPPILRFWPDVYAETSESYLFPGITVVALVLAGIVASVMMRGRLRDAFHSRSAFPFYTAATLLMYALAMGPAPEGAGWKAIAHPYTALRWVPGIHGLRVAARFTMLAVLCFSTAAAIGLSRLIALWPRLRPVLISLTVAGLVFDGWYQRMPLVVPPGRLDLPDVPGAAVLELPADDARVSIAAMYRAMSHRLPVINGYSGYTPPHYQIFGRSLRRNDPSAIVELARGRPLIIIISDRHDDDGHFRRLVERLPGIERLGAGSGGALYVLRAQPRVSTPPIGAPWSFTVSELPQEHVQLDLGSTRVVRSVEFPIGKSYMRLGARFAIEASNDGSAWTTAWEDNTGGPAVAAALRDPRRVTIKLTLPDISARYLRIHPAPRWLWEALAVRGPG